MSIAPPSIVRDDIEQRLRHPPINVCEPVEVVEYEHQPGRLSAPTVVAGYDVAQTVVQRVEILAKVRGKLKRVGDGGEHFVRCVPEPRVGLDDVVIVRDQPTCSLPENGAIPEQRDERVVNQSVVEFRRQFGVGIPGGHAGKASRSDRTPDRPATPGIESG